MSKLNVFYMAINQVNGKRYIGVTCGYLSQRIAKHFWMAEKTNSQTHFHRAIRKHGREIFLFEVLAECESFPDALKQEQELVQEFKPEYNMTKGGDGIVGFRMPRDSIERAANKRRGRPGPWAGKSLALSFLEGRKRWNYSESGRSSWDFCRKLGPTSQQKAVICLDDGQVFKNAGLAATFYDLDASLISSVCRKGRHRTAGGLVFRFCGEESGGKEEADLVRASVLSNRQRTAQIARDARERKLRR